MKLDGWKRLLIVLSLAWLLCIAVIAYNEYPTGGHFRGIPVGAFHFWSLVENPFNQFDRPNDIPAYEIHFSPSGFVAYGAGPIIVMWTAFFAIGWVRRGFKNEPHNG